MKPNELDNYSTSRIMTRCGQLDIDFNKVIDSPYFFESKRKKPKSKIQYKGGLDGTVGWGLNKKPITDKDTVPFTKIQLLNLLGYL